ncbi:MAG: trehalose-6-phosphate synthase [Gemmatimonadetes bacterium]|nr:trehalose-6-phosphate synthase [Gemmatimonadota bacterium]
MSSVETPGSSVGGDGRLIMVSNRLPIVVTRDEGGGWTTEPGSGGLVTAVAPVIRNRNGLWIGWPGNSEIPEDELADLVHGSGSGNVGYPLEPVTLTPREEQNYYYGFSNEILWPLFHDLQTRCNMDSKYWSDYKAVNRKFAQVIEEQLVAGDTVWIHDYQLFLVAAFLRVHKVRARLSFFLHIPFPSPDIFRKLPWRDQILSAMLEYDLIGFQTVRDRRNFLQCLNMYSDKIATNERSARPIIQWKGRRIRVDAFPVSIDYEAFASKAESREVDVRAGIIDRDLPDRRIVFSLDRLDYTKGVPERLRAIGRALRRFPDLHEKVTFQQVLVPSRREIPEYESLKQEIESLVSEINGEFSRSGWVPVHYFFRSLDFDELVAYYRASDIALLTPLKDGMNLVAKEYCACCVDDRGVLILSEFAGAAVQFDQVAILVNPYDADGVAEAIHRAYHMPADERRERMRRLRESVQREDVFHWVDGFLEAAGAGQVPGDVSRI